MSFNPGARLLRRRAIAGILRCVEDAAGEWLAGWNSQTLAELTRRFESLGASEPAGWAMSELTENLAQTARFLFLRALWRRLEAQLDEVDGAVHRLIAAGGPREDVRHALSSSLYSVAFDFVYLLDEPDGTFHATSLTGSVAWKVPSGSSNKYTKSKATE